jgi:hypothetical protein
MDGIRNRYNLKSTGRIYKYCVLKYSEKFEVLDLCKLIILNFSENFKMLNVSISLVLFKL